MRRILSLLVLAAALVPAARADLPTLYVRYAANCTFTVVDDNGRTVSSIAPGTYNVQVTTPDDFANYRDRTGLSPSDFSGCKGAAQFQLSGPGVSYATDLDDGANDHADTTVTLPASATYTAVDNNQPSVTRTVFGTQASGSAAAPSTPAGASNASKPSKAETSGDIAASKSAAATGVFRGSLDGIVYKSGALSLTRNGKKVMSLKTGLYTFAVDDESPRHGFSVQVFQGKPTTVTAKAYKGTHDVTVKMKPGRWFFFSPGSRKTTFFVVS